jgi:hypothetical protein
MSQQARLELHLSPQLKAELVAHARQKQVALSALGETALTLLLHPPPVTVTPSQVAHLRRELRAVHQAVEVVAETLALFINVYLSTTAEVPLGEEEVARQRGARRYARFLKTLEAKLARQQRRFPALASAAGAPHADE